MKNFLLVAALAAAAAGPAFALPPGFARQANAVLASSYPAAGPGASVAISEHGKIVCRGTRGLADIAARRPITPATVFRIGSITKQFAAATLLQLAAEGKIGLADPIAIYLPDYPNGRAITVAELLNHTSGIQDYTEIPGWMVAANMDHPYTTQQLIAVFKDLPAQSRPGEKWAYDNSGYILVGALIEAVTHKPWYRAVEERIIRPLGLSSTRYGVDEPRIAAMATGYTQGKTGIARSIVIDMTVPGAAGALVGTPSDLAVWANALHHGKVLSQPYYERMIARTKLADGSTVPYGFGIENGEVRGLPTIGHSGGIFGFVSDSLYVPGKDLFVAVYSNSDSPRTSPGVTALRLAALAIGSPFPAFKKVPIAAGKVAPMLGVYAFKDGQRTFAMRRGKLFTKRADGPIAPVYYAGHGRFFYGPDQLSWFAMRKDRSGKYIFERHADGADAVDRGIRTGPLSAAK